MGNFLDVEGVKYLWSKVNMQDYPNNETLMAVINAIDKTKADKESPIFTGIPIAPTADPHTNTTQIATTEFVNTAISDAVLRGISPVEPSNNDIPLVFFGGDLPQKKQDTIMNFRYISKNRDISGYVKIKAQGNSSLNYPKKNQTVKLYSDEGCTENLKVNFKNWGAQNKYCYKANWIDITHARNIVSAQLWGDIVKSRNNYLELPEELRNSPNQGAVDGFPVKLYANGKYQGRYTINIPKDAWMVNMDKNLDTHCMLCGEDYGSGCFRGEAKIDGTDWKDELHDVVPESVKQRWNQVISFVMTSTDEEFKQNLGNYFDVESLIDYHLFGLYSCGLDAYGKNQIYLTYDGQKWIASMYDMDSTWGLYWDGQKLIPSNYSRESYEDMIQNRQGNLLYMRLEKNFQEELTSRWNELLKGPLSISNVLSKFEQFINIAPTELVQEDYATTTADSKFTNIPSKTTNNIQQIRKFALERLSYMETYLKSLSNIYCTGITLSQTEIIATERGTYALIATIEPEDTTDSIIWSSSNEDVATVANGIVQIIYNGNATITATCGKYSATCEVTVSGITGNPNLIYSLEQPTVFDGTNYINTEIPLFNENKSYTILLDVVNGAIPNANATMALIHCMHEQSPYYGLCIQNKVSNGYTNEIHIPGMSQTNKLDVNNSTREGLRVKFAQVYNADTKTTTVYTLAPNNSIKKQSQNYDTITFNSIQEPLLIGCYQDATGTKGRFWKGTINQVDVYNKALNEDEITAFMTSVE